MKASTRTWLIGIGLSLASVIAWLAQRNGGFSESTVTAIGDYSQFGIVAVATGVLVWAALRFSPKERLRLQLLLLALGIGLFAVGQAVWTYYEVIAGVEVPYPGWPDLFFVLSYVPIAWALASALIGFRKLTSIIVPVVLAAATGAVAFAALWVAMFGDIVGDSSISVLEKVLGVAYQFGDFVVHVPLAVALVVIAARMGGGKIAWQWWAVTLGLVIVAAADTAFALAAANETYATGSIIDLGWTLGYSLVAWGGAIAVYVHKDSARL